MKVDSTTGQDQALKILLTGGARQFRGLIKLRVASRCEEYQGGVGLEGLQAGSERFQAV
jgi:hypothetical protein